ncbi:MAG: pantoate--beta-alanine ligase [Candidatus Nanopelagicales bacterium]
MTGHEPQIARTRDELRAAYDDAGPASRAVVMTMGALHVGHGQLMTAARELVGPNGHVTVTIFVNPLQFGANEDLDRYPRTFDADVELCTQRGVDLIFAPTPATMYPQGEPKVTVDPGPLGSLFEGATRPGHFAGVLTVVAKLLALTGADFALFGEKDYQQVTLIRRLVDDLDLPVEIVGVPIVRDPDGLAMSSRNKYLSADARATALVIPQAVRAATDAAAAGATGDQIVEAASSTLANVAGVEVDYVALTDPSMDEAPPSGAAHIVITAVVDGTRLLDNGPIEIVGGS